jgi:hypothetical protein
MSKLSETVKYKSSTVKSSHYNFNDYTLEVMFNTGAVYEYKMVPIINYEFFRDGLSTGKSFNEYIKNLENTKIFQEECL